MLAGKVFHLGCETETPGTWCGMRKSILSQPWNPNILQSNHGPRYTPKSKQKPSKECKHVSRKDWQNTYTVYPLTATSCVGRKELKPSQVSPQRWLVGKQGRMQGNWCVSEYMLNGISSQETANNFGSREERNPQGQKSIGLTKTRQRPRPSSMKQEQISLVWLDLLLPFEGQKQAVGKCRQMWVSQQSRESGKKTKSCIRQNLSSSRLCAASQSTCSSWSQP